MSSLQCWRVTTAPGAGFGPLHGGRGLEMGSFIAGPFCGQLLGDYGAEVIKIEPPGTGDVLRQWRLQHGRGGDGTGDSLWWSVAARNKRSITIDLRTPRGPAAHPRPGGGRGHRRGELPAGDA